MTRAFNTAEILTNTPDSDAGTGFVNRINPASLTPTPVGTDTQVLTVRTSRGQKILSWTSTGGVVPPSVYDSEIARFLTSAAVTKSGVSINYTTPNTPTLTITVLNPRQAGDSDILNPASSFTNPTLTRFKTTLDAEIQAISRQSLTGSSLAGHSLNEITGLAVNPLTGVITFTYTTTFNAAVTWTSGGTNKYAYTGPGSINRQGVTFNLSLSNNTFNVQPTDAIVIGSTTITGTDLTSLFPSGAATAVFTVPSSLLADADETATVVGISMSFTISDGGTVTASRSLTNTQPVPYSIGNIVANFLNGASTSAPFYDTLYTDLQWYFSGPFNGTPTSTNGMVVLSDAGTPIATLNNTNLIPTSANPAVYAGSFDATTSLYQITSSGYMGDNLTTGAGTTTIPSQTVNVTLPASFVPYFAWLDETNLVTIDSDYIKALPPYVTGNVPSGTSTMVNYNVTTTTQYMYFASTRQITAWGNAVLSGPPAKSYTTTVAGRGGTQTYYVYQLAQTGVPAPSTRTITITF